QVNAHRLIVHNRYHNHWNFRQLRIGFELVEYRPTVTVRHDNIQGDDHRTNLPGKPESFFTTPGSNDIEIHLGKEARHKIANRRVVVDHEDRVLVSFHRWNRLRSIAASCRLRG